MDAILKWIPLLSLLGSAFAATLAGGLYLGSRQQGRKDVEALRTEMKQALGKYDELHAGHIDSIHAIESAAGTALQRLLDHEQVDEERFGRIEGMLKESRDDIKDILKTVKGRS